MQRSQACFNFLQLSAQPFQLFFQLVTCLGFFVDCFFSLFQRRFGLLVLLNSQLQLARCLAITGFTACLQFGLLGQQTGFPI